MFFVLYIAKSSARTGIGAPRTEREGFFLAVGMGQSGGKQIHVERAAARTDKLFAAIAPRAEMPGDRRHRAVDREAGNREQELEFAQRAVLRILDQAAK